MMVHGQKAHTLCCFFLYVKIKGLTLQTSQAPWEGALLGQPKLGGAFIFWFFYFHVNQDEIPSLVRVLHSIAATVGCRCCSPGCANTPATRHQRRQWPPMGPRRPLTAGARPQRARHRRGVRLRLEPRDARRVPHRFDWTPRGDQPDRGMWHC